MASSCRGEGASCTGSRSAGRLVPYQSLLDRFELRDVAIKVVGVGSVGTSCWVFLFMAGEDDPLFLQIKEARASVLEPYAGRSVFANHGQRIVHGYRMMQPASDMFLGWSQGPERHFFIRQLSTVGRRRAAQSSRAPTS